jgi:hypothetical protein
VEIFHRVAAAENESTDLRTDIAVTCSAANADNKRSVRRLRACSEPIGKPPSRRESTVFWAGYVLQIAVFLD